MTAPVCIFLGPTLPVDQARRILDAHYLPPAVGGDVYAALGAEPAVIGLIDGCFELSPAVRHKELLYAMSVGVHVWGASSMGALRAAELAAFGMRGVGRVFEAYAQGALEDDDEVAVSHASAELGFRPLSEAMVNIRAALTAAARRRLISAASEAVLVSLAKAMFYPERTWPALLRAAMARGVSLHELARLEEMVVRERPSVKRDDAIELLRRIADQLRTGPAPHRPGFAFHSTAAWQRTMAMVDRRRS